MSPFYGLNFPKEILELLVYLNDLSSHEIVRAQLTADVDQRNLPFAVLRSEYCQEADITSVGLFLARIKNKAVGFDQFLRDQQRLHYFLEVIEYISSL